MKVSAVITTYNGEKYIESQILSIINQTRAVDEIIIGDDASSDKTVTIIKSCLKLCNTKSVLLENKVNTGLNKNMKNVLAHTTGDIIIFADQDDLWHKDKVKRMVETFENNTDIQGLLTGFKCIDENGDIIFNNSNKDDNVWLGNIPINGLTEISLESIVQYNCGPGCTLAVKRGVVETYLRSESKLIHDWQCCIISAIIGKLFYLPDVLTFYRQGNNTIGFPLTSRMNENINLFSKVKILLCSAKYWFLDLKQETDNTGIVHISSKTLELIASACQIQPEDRLTEYLKFEHDLTTALTTRNLFRYLNVRQKYKNQVYNQMRVYSFWNRCDWTFQHLRIIFDKNFLKSNNS